MDAVRMLEQDHHEIEMLFDQFERANDDERAKLIEPICREIEAHTRVEEEMFYPQVRVTLGQDGIELIDEARDEHERVTRQIREIRSMPEGDPARVLRFALVIEDIRYHLDQEESEMFPLVRVNMEPQLGVLGEAMLQQRQIFEVRG
jgi:iron-sulfur cluster repair protein YtfE (RIC family)